MVLFDIYQETKSCIVDIRLKSKVRNSPLEGSMHDCLNVQED